MKSTADTPELMKLRKNDHIRICSEDEIESDGAPFSRIRLAPEALPEMSLESVNTECSFFGSSFSMPLFITAMTGGVAQGQQINTVLAKAAEKAGIPMGLGSQKIVLTKPETRALFQIRNEAPNVFIIGIQPKDIALLVEMFSLNAFALHLNALQECIQPEGERNFTGLLKFIGKVCEISKVPIIVKEVGSGITPSTLRKLIDVGVSAVDLGGRGGTSWSVIEGKRSNAAGQRLGNLFRNWGYTTEESLQACGEMFRLHHNLRQIPLFATGGIRNGVQVASAIAMGAAMCGVGLPLLRCITNPVPGLTPQESVEAELDFFRESLTIAMFCSGAQTLSHLPSKLA
jgi:isopentenyl-diphosphate Delta-isomerase